MQSTSTKPHSSLRPPQTLKPTFRPDVEGLRAIAVCLVIASHFDLGISGGFIGVDIFFVLSGFLITNQLVSDQGVASAGNPGAISTLLRDFYARRARRILPAAVCCLSATIIAAHFLLNPGAAQSTARDGLWSFFFVENFNLINSATDYFAQGFQPSAFQHYWSLSVEEQYYLVWPILAYLTLGRARISIFGRHISALSRLTATALMFSAISFIDCLRLTRSNPSAAYFSTSVRAWELGVGALCACWAASPKRRSSLLGSPLVALFGMALLTVAVLVISPSTPFPGLAALLPTLGTAFVIVGGTARLGAVGNVLAIPPLRLIGRLSYSIYLWHWPVLTLISRRLPLQLDSWARADILILITLVLATASYLFIEIPLRKFHPVEHRHRWHSTGRRPGWRSPLTAVVLLIVTIAAVSPPALEVISSQVVMSSADIDANALSAASGASLSGLSSSGRPTAIAPSSLDREALEASTAHFRQIELQSTSLSKVPLGLSPTLVDLGASKGYQDSLCHQDHCTYGNGARKAVVIGNSFADMVFPIVTKALDPAEWTVTLQWKSGCYLAFPSRCPTVFALPKGKIDLLILSDYEGLDSSTTAAQVQAGLTASVKQFRAASDNTIYIGQPPGMKAALVDCVGADLRLSSSCYSDTGPGEIIPQPGGSVSSINSFKRQLMTGPGGLFVDPTDWLCTQGRCPPVIGNYPVYVDTQHLNAQLSSQELSKFFRLAMMQAKIIV